MTPRNLSSRRRRPTRRLAMAALLIAAAFAIGAAAAMATQGHARKAKGAVQLRKTALGKVLVDARGRTLYMYAPDRHGRSACYGGCAAAWPPLLTKRRKPALGKGVRRKLVGVTRRKDGTLQVTYRRHPLYTFVSDRKAGALNGQGYGNRWYVLHANGSVVKKMPATTSNTGTPTTTTTSGGGAWG